MGRFNLQDYEQVKDRLPQFFQRWPDGRVITDIVYRSEDGQDVVVKATLYKDHETDKALATGHAEEHQGGSGPNRDCWLENCETSAIGRALANICLHGDKRPSREEMQKAERHDLPGVALTEEDIDREIVALTHSKHNEALIAYCITKGKLVTGMDLLDLSPEDKRALVEKKDGAIAAALREGA